jgi:hypothetical protein
MNKEYKALAVLSARLAESVLMDWDKEEQVRLAKEVATKCHSIFNDKESRDFIALVKRMREAQDFFNISVSVDNIEDIDFWHIRMLELEREVDEYLKEME